MSDLHALESKRPLQPGPTGLPTGCITPLKLPAWRAYMATHPDREFATYILQGISQGFHIGFNRQAVALRQAQGNMRSIASNPTVVADYLLKERTASRAPVWPHPVRETGGLPNKPNWPNPQTQPARPLATNSGPVLTTWPQR